MATNISVSFGFDLVSEVSARVVPVEQALVYCPGLAKGLGRAVAAGTTEVLGFHRFWERKVRTLQGSEPANGGAVEDLRAELSSGNSEF